MLKDRWWKQKRGGGACTEESKKSSSVTELSLGNVGGVFVVLLGGLSLSFFLAICEFVWKERTGESEQVNDSCIKHCHF